MSPFCRVHNFVSNAPEAHLRVVDQIPDCLLHVPALYDLSAEVSSVRVVLLDDPLDHRHILRVVDDPFELVPVRDDLGAVPVSGSNVGLFIEAVTTESIIG